MILSGRRLWRACLAIGLARLTLGSLAVAWQFHRDVVPATSLDELLHLRDALVWARGPLLALPDLSWQPPGTTFLIGLLLRAGLRDPLVAGAVAGIVASAAGTVAAGLAALRLSGGRALGLVAGAVFYSGASLLNLVQLSPGLPHGLFAAAWAVAIAASVEVVTAPVPRWVPAALSLASLPLFRYEGLGLALGMGAVLGSAALVVPRLRRGAWVLPLAALPAACLLVAAGAAPFSGRSALLARDVSPEDRSLIARLGFLAPFGHLQHLSTGLFVASPLGAGLLRSGRGNRLPLLVAFAGAGLPLALYGVLFARGAVGAASYRLAAPLAAALAILAGAGLCWLADLLPRPWATLAAAGLLLAFTAREAGRFVRPPQATREILQAGRLLLESGAPVLVERGEGVDRMLPDLIAPALQVPKPEVFQGPVADAATAAAIGAGHAVLATRPASMAAFEEAVRSGLLSGRTAQVEGAPWLAVLPR